MSAQIRRSALRVIAATVKMRPCEGRNRPLRTHAVHYIAGLDQERSMPSRPASHGKSPISTRPRFGSGRRTPIGWRMCRTSPGLSLEVRPPR